MLHGSSSGSGVLQGFHLWGPTASLTLQEKVVPRPRSLISCTKNEKLGAKPDLSQGERARIHILNTRSENPS